VRNQPKETGVLKPPDCKYKEKIWQKVYATFACKLTKDLETLNVNYC